MACFSETQFSIYRTAGFCSSLKRETATNLSDTDEPHGICRGSFLEAASRRAHWKSASRRTGLNQTKLGFSSRALILKYK